MGHSLSARLVRTVPHRPRPCIEPNIESNPDTWPEHDRCYSQSKQVDQVDTGAGERTTLRKQHSDDRTGRHDQRRPHDGPGDAGQGERDKHSGDGEHDEHAGGEADGTSHRRTRANNERTAAKLASSIANR